MRVTLALLKIHLGHQSKAHWLIARKQRIAKTRLDEVLKKSGVNVYTPKEVIQPVFETADTLVEEPHDTPTHKKPQTAEGYTITNGFVPLANSEQCQILTNSIVMEHFPGNILERLETPKEDDLEFMKSAIIKSHLLDSDQVSLPKVKDVINHPGYNPERPFGVQKKKKII